MDIYAIGQIMQWYATGKTHRGTERQRITSVFEKLGIYDSIIEKCLSNNPEKRFQKISEIRDYKNRTREKDIFEYMYDFNKVLRSNFPKNDYRFIHSNNIKRIDKLFQSFKDNEKKFDKNLWWHDGSGNFEFELKKKGEGIWKFWDSEFSIREIWIHYDNSVFNDFILVHYQPSKPFKIDGKDKYHSAIVDDKHHITFSEHQNGFAEIEDEVIDLSEHKVEFIEKQEEEGYFFIGTRFHCILRTKNDENVRNFIEQITFNEGKVDVEEFQKFQREVRKHKLPEIVMRL